LTKKGGLLNLTGSFQGERMKPKIVVGVVLIVAALTYLLLGSLKDSALYYVTVSELFARSEWPVHEGLRVNGYVAPASIRWDAKKGETRFLLGEGKTACGCGIKGGRRINWRMHAGGGEAACSDRELQADKILLNCPSNNEEKKPGGRLALKIYNTCMICRKLLLI
jgi:hypothetical protein